MQWQRLHNGLPPRWRVLPHRGECRLVTQGVWRRSPVCGPCCPCWWGLLLRLCCMAAGRMGIRRWQPLFPPFWLVCGQTPLRWRVCPHGWWGGGLCAPLCVPGPQPPSTSGSVRRWMHPTGRRKAADQPNTCGPVPPRQPGPGPRGGGGPDPSTQPAPEQQGTTHQKTRVWKMVQQGVPPQPGGRQRSLWQKRGKPRCPGRPMQGGCAVGLWAMRAPCLHVCCPWGWRGRVWYGQRCCNPAQGMRMSRPMGPPVGQPVGQPVGAYMGTRAMEGAGPEFCTRGLEEQAPGEWSNALGAIRGTMPWPCCWAMRLWRMNQTGGGRKPCVNFWILMPLCPGRAYRPLRRLCLRPLWRPLLWRPTVRSRAEPQVFRPVA